MLNVDIGRRVSEEDLDYDASNIYNYNNGYWLSKFCNTLDVESKSCNPK